MHVNNNTTQLFQPEINPLIPTLFLNKETLNQKRSQNRGIWKKGIIALKNYKIKECDAPPPPPRQKFAAYD